jgi:hypothetical protein
MRITTVVTVTPTGDDSAQSRIRKMAEREQDLQAHARLGYVLAHTHVVHGSGLDTFVDTLTQPTEE